MKTEQKLKNIHLRLVVSEKAKKLEVWQNLLSLIKLHF